MNTLTRAAVIAGHILLRPYAAKESLALPTCASLLTSISVSASASRRRQAASPASRLVPLDPRLLMQDTI